MDPTATTTDMLGADAAAHNHQNVALVDCWTSAALRYPSAAAAAAAFATYNCPSSHQQQQHGLETGGAPPMPYAAYAAYATGAGQFVHPGGPPAHMFTSYASKRLLGGRPVRFQFISSSSVPMRILITSSFGVRPQSDFVAAALVFVCVCLCERVTPKGAAGCGEYA
jgi:hypothetical protein